MTKQQEEERAAAFRAGKSSGYIHETLWTVVVNPPGQLAATTRFGTEDKARAFAKGNTNAVVLPPMNKEGA